MRRSQGSALLAVMWMTVMLGLVGMALATTVRSETESTRMMAESEQGYFLARAGIDAARLTIAFPEQETQAQASRRDYNFAFDTGTVHVEYFPVGALYNVNSASVPMLTALFMQLGQSHAAASSLAEQVEHYRRPPKPQPAHDIVSMEELLSLPGMTSELFYGGFSGGKRHSPLYEVLGTFGAFDSVNPNYARPELLAALPEMNEDRAANLIQSRPILALEPGKSRGLSLFDGAVFTLIAHGRTKDSDVERVVRAVYQRQPDRPLGMRLLEWHESD